MSHRHQGSSSTALARVQEALTNAGLDPADTDIHRALAHLSQTPATGTPYERHSVPIGAPDGNSTALPTDPAPAIPLLDAHLAAAVRLRNYEPQKAAQWSPEQLSTRANRYTRQKSCDAIVAHPPGAVVEFPETGAALGQSVAHRFTIDPKAKFRPQHCFQYSLSNILSGGSNSVECYLIREGQKIRCKSVEYNCGGLRQCDFSGSFLATGVPASQTEHSFTSPRRQSLLRSSEHMSRVSGITEANIEVFRKTLGFYVALQQHGCSRTLVDGNATDFIPENQDSRSKHRAQCTGRILLKKDQHGLSYLECEHRHDSASETAATHLVLRNLQDYDIGYLGALLNSDVDEVRKREQEAAALGFGPLVSCHHSRSPRSQAQNCPHPHRGEDGNLRTGRMTHPIECSARFRIFEPHDLEAHPFILVVCTNPHSHSAPERSMTPPPLRAAFEASLRSMRWQLADATPRRIVCDSGFMAALRQILECTSDAADPALSDLHPSLGNLDHVAILIDSVRKPLYPLGTDFAGAQELYRTQSCLPPDQQYVRFAEEIQLPDKSEPDKLVVCMLPSQSALLLDAKRVEVDISFKRVSAWYEYEMVTWDSATAQSVTLCRAFMTSMSAKAHLELYRQIFRIAERDTGRKPHFLYLHGDGYEVWTADDDRGHALGLGEFLVELSRDLDTYDRFEPTKRLRDLTPYEHLARFLRLCIVHFKRNIQKLQGKVSNEVYRAMWSLAATETHADFTRACDIIKQGGRAASNWLKEKQLFALAALYQPLSKIPREIWLAGKSNTNGVEQMHRDVYRDGKSLTLLGGIQRGMQHDLREAATAALVRTEGIGRRFNASEPVYTHKRAIQRAVHTETKRASSSDTRAAKKHRTSRQSSQATTSEAAAMPYATSGELEHVLLPTAAPGPGGHLSVSSTGHLAAFDPFANYEPTQAELEYWDTIDFDSFM